MPSDDNLPAGYHPKWAEIERRMMAIEELSDAMREMIYELRRKHDMHEAVCLERQKTNFNTMAAMQATLDKMDKKIGGWQNSLMLGMFGVIMSLVGYMWTHRFFN